MSEFVIYRKGWGGPAGRVLEPTVVVRSGGVLAVNVAAMEALMRHRDAENSLEDLTIWVSLLWNAKSKQAAICPGEKGLDKWAMRKHGGKLSSNFYEAGAKTFGRHIGVTKLRRFPAHIIDYGGGSIMFDVGASDV